MKKVMIEFRDVTKFYHQTEEAAVKSLNLSIKEGELVVLVGPSGCGKTTTMKMINRLIEPSEGTVYVNGEDISSIDPLRLRQDVGYVIQHTGLFPHMSIEENIATVPKLKKWPKEKVSKRVKELLDLVGLDQSMRKKLPKQLSGGQQQRIGVARALAADPPIMLMDEPFGALDPITREHLQNEFLSIQQNVNKTIVFVTHDIDEAVKMGNRIVVMRNGKVLQNDTPEAILKTPVDEFIANLTGEDRAIKYLSLIPVISVMSSVNDVASLKNEFSIRADRTLKDALIKMLQHGVTELIVENTEGINIGYVSLNNLVKEVFKEAV